MAYALGSSLLLAVTCSVVAGTSGILVGYGVAKRRGSRLASWVNSLSFFPYLMPSLAFGAIYLSMSSHVAWLRGFALLALVGLPDKADAYPAQLSGGQSSRCRAGRDPDQRAEMQRPDAAE